MMIGWCGMCRYKARETWVSTAEHMLHVKFFIKMKKDAQELWITNMLAEIQAKKDVEIQRWSMDSSGPVMHQG